ncbi:MAG: hypothetical protein J0I77_02060 [Rudaea sp.]|uniref:hypothetical protein n=1 Tax=unclassified Rudaea TaxID=2627037 RepID=UPI0010F7B883|nr:MULTISPECIES: hypothetical protein [unclassified Rudaea]MBN8884480.1 hypothetical protein [Rudaea sp.]
MNKHLLRLLTLSCCAASAAAPAASSPPHYLTVVNDGQATIRTFEFKPEGINKWEAIDVGDQRSSSDLHPGESVQVALRHGCVYDLRVTFADQRSVTVTEFNACKASTLHAGHALRMARAQSGRPD